MSTKKTARKRKETVSVVSASPRVSVCTSVLNQSQYLKRMIESVRAQTLQEWELVIVDDGSTEDIKTLVESFNDQRIKLTQWAENRGIPHGLNHAFKLAVGDYLQPLSADEFISPTKLADQVEYLDANQGVGCVWGLPGKGEMGARPSWEQYALKAHNRSREAWIRTLIRLENIPIGGATLLMRRECMDDIGGFDPQFFHCSDLELFVRFFQKFEGRVLCSRNADAEQPPERLTAPSELNAARFQADIKQVRAKHGVELPPMGRLTIAIPVFNMAHLIRKTLDSLLAQTNKDFDIMILDDGSTDDLTTAVLPYADRINFLRVEENMGIARTVNALIASCETQFISFLPADDWIEPTYVERVMKEFEADPWLEFVASQTDFVDEAGKPIPPDTIEVQKIERAANKSREQWLARLWYGNVYFGIGAYRTHVLKEIGGFDSNAGVLTDYDVYLKLLQRENIKIIEEPLTHTRIHPGNASVGSGKFTAQWLRDKYSEIKKRYYQPRRKVIFMTPFYNMQGFSPYIHSMFYTAKMLTTYGIDCDFWELSGDSYVDRAKNTLFNKFLEDPDATDLVMIDSDMQWNPDAVFKILQLPEPLIIGSYPQKNAWSRWTASPRLVADANDATKMHPVGRVLADGSALIQAEYVSGGFVFIKRDVLKRFKEKYTEDAYQDASADPSTPERLYTNYFQCEVKDGLRWGEDRVFGKRLAAMGIDVFIYPNIDFGHYGIKGFMGNFDKFLRNPQAPAQAPAQAA